MKDNLVYVSHLRQEEGCRSHIKQTCEAMCNGCGGSGRDCEAPAVPHGWKSPAGDGLLPCCKGAQRASATLPPSTLHCSGGHGALELEQMSVCVCVWVCVYTSWHTRLKLKQVYKDLQDGVFLIGWFGSMGSSGISDFFLVVLLVWSRNTTRLTSA